MATHSSILAWRIPGTEEPGGLPSLGRTESDMTDATQQQQQSIQEREELQSTLSIRPVGITLFKMKIQRHSRKWQPIPIFLPRESHGQGSLVGNSPQGHKESDMTEATQHACKHYRSPLTCFCLHNICHILACCDIYILGLLFVILSLPLKYMFPRQKSLFIN